MTALNIGLIGAGRIGQIHAKSITTRIPSARLLAVADVVEDAAVALATECDVHSVYASYDALLENPAVDAIVIASATDTHASIIQRAAAAGKHIFCEKPLALELRQIDAAIEAAARAGVKLQVGFNRRFDANFARVRHAVQSGEIGVPHLLHIISRDPAPPPLDYIRVSGGLFLDMMIHDFDMVRFIMGCEAAEIYAIGSVLVDPTIGDAGDIDTAMVSLRFENGALGVIDNSRQAIYGYDQRLDLLGSEGSIRVDNSFPNQAIISTSEHVRRDLPLHFFLERYAESYVAELDAFVEAVFTDSDVPVSGYDGKMPVVMALAAKKSLTQHRPVSLDEIVSA